jgi:hypothetical protein
MTETGVLGAGGVSAAFTRYDPLAPQPRDRALHRVLLVSIAIHLLLLFLFWDSIIGVVMDDEDTVVVRMVEEKPPPPRPKVIAQTRLNTKVRKRRDVKREIQKIKPVERLDQVKMTQIDPLQKIEAPKLLEQRERSGSSPRGSRTIPRRSRAPPPRRWRGCSPRRGWPEPRAAPASRRSGAGPPTASSRGTAAATSAGPTRTA